MSGACLLGFDADDILQALDGERGEHERADATVHVEQCATCGAAVRARSLARRAWSAAARRDDAFVREASEARLAATWPRPQVARGRGFVLGFAAAAAVAALVLLVGGDAVTGTTRRAWLVRREPARVVLRRAPAVEHGGDATSAASLLAREVRAARRAVVVTSACATCKVAGAPIAAGAELAAGARVAVPSGARVTLGFAFDDGLVDPRDGADVEGPASAGPGDATSLAVDRGSAHVRAAREVVVVVPGGHLVARGAIYTLRVDERGVARITVESGSVRVVRSAPPSEQSFAAGATTIVSPAGVGDGAAAPVNPAGTPASAAAAVDPSARGEARDPVSAKPVGAAGAEAAVLDARQRARAGDATARALLESMAQGSDGPSARRAAFTLAELDLAAGERARAQGRLLELLGSSDAPLAFDAATLYARSHPAAAARADAWRRYLTTSPRSPFRERALLDRAEALVDTGDPRRRAEAEALLAELRHASGLTEREARQLERLTLKLRDPR